MQKRSIFFIKMCLVLFMAIFSAGCALVLQSGRRSDVEKIENLSAKVEELERLKNEETKRLKETRALLEKMLKKEIEEKQVRLSLNERGLVITFVAEVLFDSGKAEIRPEAYPILDKVANILNSKVEQENIGIEGHTDNQPIKYSSWKSNWELSTARANSVLHYLVAKKGVRPERVSSTGYGEHRPIASNNTKEGRQKNRRVEVIVLPKYSHRMTLEEFLETEKNESAAQENMPKYKK